MNIPQGSQDGKQVSPRRPGMVTALALLVALDAIAEGCGGLTDAIKSSNSLVGGVTAIFMLVLIAVVLALAWGLWQMKNWACVGVIIVIIISFLLSIPQFITDTSENPGLLFFVILLALVFHGAIIYWLAVNGKYFNNAVKQVVITGNEATPAVGDAGSGMAMAIANAGGSGGISRKTIIGLIAGVSLIVIIACVVIGYFIYMNTRPIATQTMTFGSSAVEQGALNEPHVIGVDGNGNTVVGDLKDGQVRTFDSSGKVISSFSIPKGTAGYTYILGMAVSRDGKIYIAGDVDNAILIFDESGHSLGEIAVNQDDYLDVAIAPDGTLYALGDTDLVRFNKDGSVALKVQISDTVDTTFSDLAVDGLGNIYIAERYGKVYKFSPSGTLLSQFSRETDNSYTEKIAVDEYGRIFVTDLSKKSIQVFDSSGNHLSDIPGIYDGIAFDQQNNLYANEAAGNVVKFKVQSGAAPIANYASGNSNNPVVPTPTPAFANNTVALSGTEPLPVSNMMLTNDGHLVLGYADGHVQVLDTGGNIISTLPLALQDPGDAGSGFESIAMDKNGNVYAVEVSNIYVFDNTGKLVKTIQGRQHYYRTVILGPDDTLYAYSDQDSTIVHFDAKLKIDFEIPNILSPKNNGFFNRACLAIDQQGNIYAAGEQNGLVLKFTPQGHAVKSFNLQTSLSQGALLRAIAVDGYGRIYVGSGNGVQVYDPTGTYLNSVDTDGFSLAVDSQGNLYALDDNGKVQVFQLAKPLGQ